MENAKVETIKENDLIKTITVRGCSTVGCAIGLARYLWPKEFSIVSDYYSLDVRDDVLASNFLMTLDDVHNLFFSCGIYKSRLLSSYSVYGS
jgi:hypothetical protein